MIAKAYRGPWTSQKTNEFVLIEEGTRVLVCKRTTYDVFVRSYVHVGTHNPHTSSSLHYKSTGTREDSIVCAYHQEDRKYESRNA